MLSDAMRMFPLGRVVEHAPGTRSFLFDVPFEVVPGQFVMLWLPGADEKPFSASDCCGGTLEITVRAVGPFTRRLMEVRPGTLLGLRGPFGNGFPVEGRCLLVGGGMGIAPLRHLSRVLAAGGPPPTLLLGVRTARDLFFAADFTGMGARIMTEDGSLGEKGLATAPLDDLLGSGRFGRVCACGPEAMLVAVHESASRHGIPCSLSLERYMKCGLGVCGQCCLDGSGVRLCCEGPVLSGEQLAGVTELGLPHRDASGLRPGGGR